MGSIGNTNPWTPIDSYKDCSQEICSIYCPQWCYFLLPPPPPIDQEHDSNTTFSPLIISIIAILASAFVLVSYYTIITKYCKGRRTRNGAIEMGFDRGHETLQDHHDQLRVVASTTGLDEAIIKAIAVCKFKKGEGLVEGSECVVCLSEFQEDEKLRLLPKCSHAFHLPCIDAWFKSHSNCPLCRAYVVSPPPHLNSLQNSATNINVNALQFNNNN